MAASGSVGRISTIVQQQLDDDGFQRGAEELW
jgi:hypothetical protein